MAEDPIKAVLHYAQALKAPRIRGSAARLAEQARDANWTHEEYSAAVLSREVVTREASGATTRIRSAGFPTRKSLEEFNFDHQPALNRDMIAHPGTGAFLTKASNVCCSGRPLLTGSDTLETMYATRGLVLGRSLLLPGYPRVFFNMKEQQRWRIRWRCLLPEGGERGRCSARTTQRLAPLRSG